MDFLICNRCDNIQLVWVTTNKRFLEHVPFCDISKCCFIFHMSETETHNTDCHQWQRRKIAAGNRSHNWWLSLISHTRACTHARMHRPQNLCPNKKYLERLSMKKSHETKLCNHTECCVSYILILRFFSCVLESWSLSSGRSFNSI